MAVHEQISERDAYIALNMMSDIGPVGVRALVRALGSAAEVFAADGSAIRSVPGIGRPQVEAVLRQRGEVDWRREIERSMAMGLSIVTPLDGDYPERLRTIHDPPLALYVKGRFSDRDRHALAVVGTRHPSHYGRDCSERFAMAFSRMGYSVISGLAEGVDTVAHAAVLKVGGRTIGVLGGGFGHFFPASNMALAERMAAEGAVLSELPLDRAPDKTTFPMRNRIVSGMSDGVLVVEAGANSGALITARMACEQGRPVFAVPGRIDSAQSAGCHALIRDGAVLVRSPDDVLGEFEGLFAKPVGAAASTVPPRPALSPDEERIVALVGGSQRGVDEVIRESGLPASAVSGILIGLEMKRLVRMLPGRVVAPATPAAG
jgi:DNA processing protein